VLSLCNESPDPRYCRHFGRARCLLCSAAFGAGDPRCGDPDQAIETLVDQREAIADQRETEQNPGRSEVAVETIPSPGLDGDPSLGGLPERFLRGTVLDEKYAPIAEAWVLTDQEHDAVQTDEAGVFEVALLHDFGPSEGRTITAWKEGLSLTQKHVRQLEDNLLILKPDEGVEITVLDAESGLPIEGAEVELLIEASSDTSAGFFDLRNFASLPTEVKLTDADGKTKILDPNISNNFTLEVRKEGYVKRYVDQWNLRRQKEIRLAAPKELRMRFVSKEGKPHAGAQLCFPWYRKIVTLDDDGWGDLPPEAAWGFWGVQLRDAGTQWVWTEVDDSRIQSGAELATDWRPRKGRLYVQGDEKPTVFEVGTSAAQDQWGWQNFLPSPQWNAESVDWVQVDEDGHFELSSGWQGETTYLHVRRVGSDGVMLSQKLIGDGPYELTLSAAAQVAVEVRCPRPELLEGASLTFYGHQTEHEQTISLEQGKASMRLPADRYSCRLTLANAAHELPLEDMVVLGLDMEHVFHFAGVRTVGGVLSAGGKPLFPCRLDVRYESFSVRTETRPDGSWAIENAPKEDLRIRVMPEDGWLSPVEGSYLWIPAEQERFDHDYLTATLLLSLGSFPSASLAELRASRRSRDGMQSNAGFNGERQRFNSTNPEIPELTAGPVEILVTPGRVSFSADRSGVALAELELELAAGDVRTFKVDTLPTTITRVLVSGFREPIWGNVDWTPVNVPGLKEYPSFVPQNARDSGRAGQLGNSIHLLPGVWRLKVRAPFWSNEYRGQVGEGEIAEELVIGGKQTTVRIEMDEQDRIKLAPSDSN
jgi:hypothetical protein